MNGNHVEVAVIPPICPKLAVRDPSQVTGRIKRIFPHPQLGGKVGATQQHLYQRQG